jgi:hypothetical protein
MKKKLLEILYNDIPSKIIVKYDKTFWMHFTREFLIVMIVGWLDVRFAVGIAIGINIAWEYKDGLNNDGLNILDFLAGIIGTILGCLPYVLK